MKKVVAIIIMVLLVTGVCNVHAESIVFTESGQILEGEVWDFVDIYNDDTVVDMFGGVADYITTYDWSTLNVTGGSADFGAVDYSTMNISGGTHSGALAWAYGTVNFSDTAESRRLDAWAFGTVNMTGGIIEGIGALDSGTVNLYGGEITDAIGAGDSSIINIFGYDLALSSSGGEYGYGLVSGFWQNDTPFEIDLSSPETYSHINLIPEPGTLVLMGFGVMIMKRRSKR